MSRTGQDGQSDLDEPVRLARFERWTRDADGEPIIEWDTDAYLKWTEKWAPDCPVGNPQRVRRALGFRERNVGELELRVALCRDEGVCEVIVDDRDDEVHVRVVVCCDERDDRAVRAPRDYTDCPVRVWLDRPLGERAVVDIDSDEELAAFAPRYRGGVPQPDHGYRPANRRRRPKGSN